MSSSAAASTGDAVILPRNFDITRLTFGQPKQLNNGGRSIYINYGGQPCYIQTPVMKTPFGISMWPSDNGGPDKYNLDLSFEGREQREQLQCFFDALQAIDKRLVQDAMDNSQLWFKKPRFAAIEVVEALYTPTIRYSKDRETGEINSRYAPTFKTTLPFKDGKFLCPAYDGGREELDILDVLASGRSKGAQAQAIVQLSGVWMVGSKFGVTWKVKQLKLIETSRLGLSYAFVKTEEDAEVEDDAPAPVVRRLAAPPPAVAAKAAVAPKRQEMLPESDDEDVADVKTEAVDDEGIEP